MKNPLIITLGISIVVFILAKLLQGTFLVSFILALSVVLIYFLSKFKEKNKILSIGIGSIILGIDLFLLILLIIPVKAYDINVKDYYVKKENYARIFIKDKKKDLKDLKLIIENGDEIRKSIRLSSYKKGRRLKLYPKDKIYFVCIKKNKCPYYRSFLVIYMWDDSIFRVKPGTVLKLSKIIKNLDDLTESKTEIEVEKGNIWFHVVRLIKDSNSMKIKTGKGQSLIIRGTAGYVSKYEDTTYAVDYSHYIEVKTTKKSKLLKEGEGAIIKGDDIKVSTMDAILKKIGVSKFEIQQFENLDKKYFKKVREELNNYIKKFYDMNDKMLGTLGKMKLKLLSLGNDKYKEYLDNITNYEYLIGKSQEFAGNLLENSNLTFLATNLKENTELKILYLKRLINEKIGDIDDIYKTYIVNLGIEGKIKNLDEYIERGLKNIDINTQNFLDNIKF